MPRRSVRAGLTRAAVLVASAVLALGAGGAYALVVTGTPGPDRLTGTGRGDELRGLAGRDRLVGLAGGDFLDGGPGRDAVDGGRGDDRIAVEYDGARDSVRCGPGSDVVNADPLDAVARDCELVGRRLSRDPYTDPEAQHETQVEPDSFTFGRTTVAAFQVGRRQDGGATNNGWATTTDGGRTWRSGLLPGLTVASRPPGPNARASDPVVAYDAANGVWLVSSLALAGSTTRLTINHSPDGLSWSPALTAAEERAAQGIAFDKNWLACDNSATSPFFGRCYLVYTHVTDRDHLALVFSDDGGVTWSLPTTIGARPAVGAFPVVRPTGELVVVYLWETRPFSIGASRSLDGGVSFEAPVRVADLSGRCAVEGFRAFPLPAADVDPSGAVWTAWHCAEPGAPVISVFVARSADGSVWGPPRRVTSGRHAVVPALGIAPSSGRMALAYHVVGPQGVDVELVESRDGGASWSRPRRLSARSMSFEWMPRTTSGRMLADYISVHYAGGRPLVVWVLASEPFRGELRQAVYATRG